MSQWGTARPESVSDPDLDIRGGGGRSPNIILVWSYNKGGRGPPGPSPGSTIVSDFKLSKLVLLRERVVLKRKG